MKNVNYKHLILILGVCILLDLVSTHQVASLMLGEDLSIVEVASAENNPIISFFWIQTNSLLLGEILDFVIKIGMATIILKLVLKWQEITPFPDTFIFTFTLAISWFFLFGGFIHNTVYLFTEIHLGYIFNFLKWSLFFIIGISGYLIAMTDDEKYMVKIIH